MDIPHELVEQFTRANGVVFIGACPSIGSGLPGWGCLIRHLASELDDCPPNASYPDIDQYYQLKHGRNRLVTQLQQKLDTFNLKPTIVHNSLVNLPINHIFTTNYDDLLEEALHALNLRYNLIIRNVDINFWNPDRIQLVKLHGDLSQPDTIIIASSDYEQYFHKTLP